MLQVNIQGNPVVEEKGDDFKKEFLILLHDTSSSVLRLKKLNKEELTDDDYKDAKAEKLERDKAAEEARLEAEKRGAEGGDNEGAQAEDE